MRVIAARSKFFYQSLKRNALVPPLAADCGCQESNGDYPSPVFMISRPFLVEATTTTKECLLDGKGGAFRWVSDTVAAHPLGRKKPLSVRVRPSAPSEMRFC